MPKIALSGVALATLSAFLVSACNTATTGDGAAKENVTTTRQSHVQAAASKDLAATLPSCGPISLEYTVVGAAADGRFDVVFKRSGGGLSARIERFKASATTSSPEGPVSNLDVAGNKVSFVSKTGFSYDLSFNGCQLAKGVAQGNHPQAGLLWITLRQSAPNTEARRPNLSSDDLRSVFVGNTMHGDGWKQWLSPDGNVRGVAGHTNSYNGEWSIDGSRLCMKFATPTYDFCGTATELPDGSYGFYDDRGTQIRHVRVSAGRAGNI